jgi:uncharacterized delta-60 repeat protein
VAVVSCGGGGGNPGGSTLPPAPAGIGASGGTVTEASGAKAVIPAGALTAQTDIKVTQTSAGAPALPAGVTAFGQIYAFTPHGTSFATPVTITVPFDSGSVPAGTSPTLYKTDAALSAWAVVSGAVVNGNTMSGEVLGFSDVVVGSKPPPALEKGAARRDWTVLELTRNHSTRVPDLDHDAQTGGKLEKLYDFGPALMPDPGVIPDLLPRELRATGRIFSSPGGGSYGVSNEVPAPVTHADDEVAGSFTDFNQSQSYIKRIAGARLALHITQARLEAFDDATPDPGPCARPGPRCFDQKYGQIIYIVKAYTKPSTAHPTVRKLFEGVGFLNLAGWRRHWTTRLDGSHANADVHTLIWNDQDVQTDLDVDAVDGRHARTSLKKALTVPVDISSVDVNEELTLQVQIDNYVFDGRPAPEFNYLGAFMRDPTLTDGDLQLVVEGLDPTDSPTEPPVDDPSLSTECRARPDAGQLMIASSRYSVPEGAGSDGINLLVMRAGGHAGEVTASVTTSDGSATAPADYQSVSTTVTFKDGENAPRFINVPLVYSADAEGDKTFSVTLSAPTGCATLGQASSVVTIIDDTRPVPVSDSFSLGGTVTGLGGSGLALRTTFINNVQPSADGPFTFPRPLGDGTAYSVTIETQPTNPTQVCTVTNGNGTIAGADVSNILVKCVTPPPQSGLDSTFGSQGKMFNTVGSARVLGQQADGKLLALGPLTLNRYNADGSVDTAFGIAGKVDIVTGGSQTDKMMALAVQPDGKIVVVGNTSSPTVPNIDFIVLRYNADGNPDTSFGTGGMVVTDFEGGRDEATSVMLRSDGKMVVTGDVQIRKIVNAGTVPTQVVDQDFGAVRYLSDGTLDASFGSGGKSSVDAGGVDYANAAAMQSDGGIVIVGRSTVSGGTGDPDMAIARLLTNGIADPGFGTGGVEHIDFASGVVPPTFNGGGTDEALDVAIESDGRILVAGYALKFISPQNVSFAALFRLSSTGAMDQVLGARIPSAINRVNGVALQADGKFVIAGRGADDFELARFTADGALDTSFGSSGLLSVDFFDGSDEALDVLVQSDGRIVAGGRASNGTGGGVGIVRVVP